MTFDEKLNELINEVEVPDELSPHNIAKMLKANNAQSKMESEHRYIKSVPSIAAQRRTIIMRTAAATAACAVFAAGMIAFNRNNDDAGQIDEQIDYSAVSPTSYDDLYKMYTGIYLDGIVSGDTSSETDIPEEIKPDATQPPIANTEPEPEETLSDLSSYEFSDIADKRISEADIVKSDGTNLYCINNGKLYIVSLETLEVVAELENKLNPPVELYIDGDTLILVSKENDEIQIIDKNSEISKGTASENSQPESNVPAADTDSYQNSDKSNVNSNSQTVSPDGNKEGATTVSRTNVIVDVYNISDKTNPVHTTTYKQNGSYTSSRIVDGVLYAITCYCDYRTAPLAPDADLDNYVPAYYIDGEKKYVAAENITVPANANSTDYTVLSAINYKSSTPSVTVKAVLGSSKNVYCSADTLYIVGTGKSSTNTDYSIITSFDLSNGMSYKASGSIAGSIIGQYSMNEYNGLFRIAASQTDENGINSASVYSLDEALTAVNSAGQLLPGQNVTAVRFEENYASLYVDNNSDPAIVVDLSSNPPVQAQSLAGSSAYLYGFSEKTLLGLGKSEKGLTLTMYSAENGLMLNTVAFADDLNDLASNALKDRRAVLIDNTKKIIGIPVYGHNEFGTDNRYYVFEYDDNNGFVQKGVIEYNDIDDSGVFERAVIDEDTLYIIGGSKIVSVQLEDLKVIDSFEF